VIPNTSNIKSNITPNDIRWISFFISKLIFEKSKYFPNNGLNIMFYVEEWNNWFHGRFIFVLRYMQQENDFLLQWVHHSPFIHKSNKLQYKCVLTILDPNKKPHNLVFLSKFDDTYPSLWGFIISKLGHSIPSSLKSRKPYQS